MKGILSNVNAHEGMNEWMNGRLGQIGPKGVYWLTTPADATGIIIPLSFDLWRLLLLTNI